jgi:hypothetical protein
VGYIHPAHSRTGGGCSVLGSESSYSIKGWLGYFLTSSLVHQGGLAIK